MAEQKFFTYKGLPLVRKGNQIYYGAIDGDTVAMLQIMSTRKVGDLEVADRIKIFLMLTDTEGVDPSEIFKNNTERNGLYEALDLAYVWLSRSA